jgi:hypothetical protein
MVSRHTRYKLAQVAWMFVAFGTGVFVLTGQVTIAGVGGPPTGPQSAAVLFGGLFAVVAGGALVVSTAERRAWERAGRRAGLASEGSVLPFLKPDLVGHVRGRAVRVRTKTRGSSGGESNSTRRYTIVETQLRGTPDTGLVGVRQRASVFGGTAHGFEGLSAPQVTVGGFTVLGPAEGFVRAVFSPRVQSALDDTEVSRVYVGDAAGTLTDATNISDSVLGGLAAKGIAAGVPGDATTVSVVRRGVALESDDLERQIQAVVELAEAFEAAAAETT